MDRNIQLQILVYYYHIILNKIQPKLISDEKAVIRYYKSHTNGIAPNLKNPQKFSEKLQWYKLYNKDPLMEKCADKYDVREYITACGYEHLLNECYGVYNAVDEINIDELPQSFVLKAAHSSGMNLIVHDKDKIDWKTENKLMRLWLKLDNYWSGREWVYKNMKKRIVAEKYLEDESGGLLDYKFYCFNGQPRFVQLEVGRYTSNNTRNFYDMDWNLMPFGKEIPHNPDIIVEKPYAFEEMKQIAADLSKPFSYVRVDLYQVQGKVFFGELTFFPAGGAPDFVPSEYDKIVGDMWDITGAKK